MSRWRCGCGAAVVLAACSRDPAPAPSPSASASTARTHSRPPSPAPLDAADGGLLARKLPRIEHRGGPFLRHPKIVTITFTKDDPKIVARVEQLGSTLTRSAWWHAVIEGYCNKEGECVGDGGAAAPVHLDDVLPTEMRDSDIDALLLAKAKAGRLGPIDKDTLLLLYLPKGVGLSDKTTPRYCADSARAFHRAIEIAGARVPFAVLPRCGDEAMLTGTASHEILEATTNAFPAEPGFTLTQGSVSSGFTAAGVEPVDPCGLVMMDKHWTNESGFVVHRAWSNRAAGLAHDPCVPSRPELPYAALVPRDLAVRLAKDGEEVTVQLDASAAGVSERWTASAFDLSGRLDHEQYVDLALDKTTVAAGDTVKLTIKSLKKNPKQREIVALVSTLGAQSHVWPLLVMMR